MAFLEFLFNQIYLYKTDRKLSERPSLSTSKYEQDYASNRRVSIKVGESDINFSLEPIKSKQKEQRDRLQLNLVNADNQASKNGCWEDNDEASLEDQLTGVL